jgi:hypothetical protein
MIVRCLLRHILRGQELELGRHKVLPVHIAIDPGLPRHGANALGLVLAMVDGYRPREKIVLPIDLGGPGTSRLFLSGHLEDTVRTSDLDDLFLELDLRFFASAGE